MLLKAKSKSRFPHTGERSKSVTISVPKQDVMCDCTVLKLLNTECLQSALTLQVKEFSRKIIMSF